MAKKNPWLKLRLGGDPLKTHYTPHFHHFSFPVPLFQHSWHASSLISLSFHSSPSRLHTCLLTHLKHLLSNENWMRTVVSKAFKPRATHTAAQAPVRGSKTAAGLTEVLGSIRPRQRPLSCSLRWQGCAVPAPRASSVTAGRRWQGHSCVGRGSDTPVVCSLPVLKNRWGKQAWRGTTFY